MKGKKIEKADLLKAINSSLKENPGIFISFTKDGDKFRLESSKGDLDDISLINPVFSASSAIYLRRVFSKGIKVIFIFRPCETRAFVELSKLTQLERDSFISGSVDCFGTLSSKLDLNLPSETRELIDFLSGSENLRYSCKVCRNREGIFGDFGIRLDKDLNLWFVPYTERALEVYQRLPGSEETLPRDLEAHARFLEEKFQSNLTEFRREFEECIMCLNCRDMCPLCFCIDCLFNQDLYLPKGDSLINKALSDGKLTFPFGMEVYHFIRMYHLSVTCCGCGACEEACPKGIGLAKYFIGVSQRVSRLFDYLPGRSFEEKIPFTIFREDEFLDAED